MQTGMLMLPAAIVTGIMMPISGSLFNKLLELKWTIPVSLL